MSVHQQCMFTESLLSCACVLQAIRRGFNTGLGDRIFVASIYLLAKLIAYKQYSLMSAHDLGNVLLDAILSCGPCHVTDR